MLTYAYLAAGLIGLLMVIKFIKDLFTDQQEIEDDDFPKFI